MSKIILMVLIFRKMLLLFIFMILIKSSCLIATDFNIMDFSDPNKYEWEDETDRLTFRDDYYISDVLLEEYRSLKQSPMTNALKTAFAPGWGHFSLGSNTKGQIFLVSQLALLGSSIYYYERSMIHYRKYKTATQIDEINEHYTNALLPYRQSNLLFGLFVIIWSYTIYDVIVETSQYNWDRWNELTEKQRNQNLIITPTGVSLRF